MSLILSSFPFDDSDVDRVFGDVFSNTANRPRSQGNGSHNHSHVSRAFRPRMDVQENKEANLVTATFELPGLKKEDVAIDVHNGRLVVSGHVHQEKKEGYVVRERRAGKFMRQLSLPSGVKTEDIKAALADGVLTVTWPRTTTEQQAKRIAIN